MILTPLAIAGVWQVDLEPIIDERGFFARSWCRDEFSRAGINADFIQASISFNARKGTLRGMHWQAAPHAEGKLVRCVRGAIYDVVVDVRPGSPSYRRWLAQELTADNRKALYIAEGLAHGFLSLVDDSEVLYQITTGHAPTHARGFRWDDPAVGIPWPAPPSCISERDRSLPLLTGAER